MAQSFTTGDLQEVLAFPFRDPQWKAKLAIAGALMLAGMVIPLVPILFLYGYFAELMRRAIAGREEPLLPEWQDWGRLLLDGLRLTGVGLVYWLPIFLLFFLGFGLIFGLSWLPLVAAGSDPSSAEVIAWPLLSWVAWMGIMGVATLLSLAVGAILPGPVAHAIVKEEFAAAFRFREWWPIYRANLGGFLLSYAILAGVSMVVSLVAQVLYMTVVLCCLAPFALAAASVYVMVVAAVLFGQAYRAGVERLAGSAGV